MLYILFDIYYQDYNLQGNSSIQMHLVHNSAILFIFKISELPQFLNLFKHIFSIWFNLLLLSLTRIMKILCKMILKFMIQSEGFLPRPVFLRMRVLAADYFRHRYLSSDFQCVSQSYFNPSTRSLYLILSSFPLKSTVIYFGHFPVSSIGFVTFKRITTVIAM